MIEQLRRAEGTRALDDATLFLRAFGHGVVAWLWLELALTDGAAAEGRWFACRFFFEAELPQARTWLDIVAGQSVLARSIPEEAFA